MQAYQNLQTARDTVNPVQRPYAPTAADNDLARRAAFFCALAVIFIRFSMIHELITYLTGVNTRMLYLVGPPAILGAILAGAPRRAFAGRIGICWLGFTVWMAAAIPFSSWPGGSIQVLLTWVRTELPMLLLAGGLIRTAGEVRAVFYIIGVASLFNVMSGSMFLNDEYERLMLSFSTVGNANDYAAHLLVTLPFLLYIATQNKRTIVRLGALGLLLFGFKLLLQTGSRGGLLALVMAAGVYFLTSPMRKKMMMAIAVPVAGLAIISVIPQTTLNRLVTISETDQAELSEAVGSTEAREYVLRKSLEFTFSYPLFGVGPGQFATAEGMNVRAEGGRGYWHDTHNAYTQISSEMGIPGFLFYVTAIFSTISFSWKVWQRAGKMKDVEMAGLAQCVLIASVACAVAILFLSLGYRYYFLALGGLTMSLMFIQQQRMMPGSAAMKPVR